MEVFLFLLSFLLSSTVAQPLIHPLTSGASVSGTLLSNASPQDAEVALDYYSIELPLNVKSVTIDFDPDPSNTRECGFMYLYYTTRGVPCGTQWTLPAETSTACRNTGISAAYDSKQTLIVPSETISATENLIEGGTTLYLSIGKTQAFYSKICPYFISVTVDNCTATQVGITDYAGVTACVEVLDRTFPMNEEMTINATRLANNQSVVFRFPIPSVESERIQVNINSTGDLYASGSYHFPAVYYGDDCYDYGYENNGYYTASFNCPFPKKGWFYLVIYKYENGAPPLNATISVTKQNVTYSLFNINEPYFMNYTTIRGDQLGELYYPSDLYYMDFPVGTLANVQVTFCMGYSYYAEVLYRKDGYPHSNIAYDAADSATLTLGECWTFVLRPEDTYVGGRFAFCIENHSSESADYQITVTISEATPSTSGQVTTGGDVLPSPSSKRMGPGAVTGIIVGVLVLIGAVGIVIYVRRRKEPSKYLSL